MRPRERNVSRRAFLASVAAVGVAAQLGRTPASAAPSARTKAIPATGERVPVIGMGSWITFDVGDDPRAREARVEVLRAFFEGGGGMVDSSPMYGSSEAVIGYCLGRIGETPGLFSATKVWSPMRWHGVNQMRQSRELWGEPVFDLVQVHNLVGWEAHLETLKAWKAEGRVRYIGVTTSHGRRHDKLARVMERESIDFVQLTYNPVDREAERRLLPLAQERGLAVIANRPFRRGALFDRVAGRPLPEWAGAFDCDNWAQFFLKFIVSHPAITCAIPATSRVDHMRQNMAAAHGRLPDPEMRRRMLRALENL